MKQNKKKHLPVDHKDVKSFNCFVCGKFIAHDNIHVNFQPDTHFTTERIEYYHKECYEK